MGEKERREKGGGDRGGGGDHQLLRFLCNGSPPARHTDSRSLGGMVTWGVT